MVILQLIDPDALSVTMINVNEEHHDLVANLHGRALQEKSDEYLDTIYKLLGSSRGPKIPPEFGTVTTLDELHDKDEAIDHLYWFFYN